MAASLTDLDSFEPSKAGAYDPGVIRIFYDNRTFAGFEDKLPFYQKYYLEALSRLNWTSWTPVDNLFPGYIRLVFYTHAGAQGCKDFPLHKAMAVKEMFDDLSNEGFRPMILGYSNENPFPMIGGVEPPPPPKKKEPKRAKTWSGGVSGHGYTGTPHDRVMAIIRQDEEQEARLRETEVREFGLEKEGAAV
ncbi:Hypothetical predicted protein [Lecanosticta acicola]|uniref:Uncharacterized protein n=1 Tax=Lecanosticta acicola TaxID=111012 RepID=A0AAI8Z5U7_9PEZI|nr:Hypothetical predicted protein [Lecanosticta acicola]